ncbi:MAG: carboxypeptidase-like regulatory domain-containing protein, partial [Terriglobales bacterium]
MGWLRRIKVLVAIGVLTASALASEYRGRVLFHGVPVPGATVTLEQGGKKIIAITDAQGLYSFADVADGSWLASVEMLGFATVHEQIMVAPGAPVATWELKLLSLEEIRAQTHPETVHTEVALATPPTTTEQPKKSAKVAQLDAGAAPENPEVGELNQRSADGLLINGSANNAETGRFGLPGAFGNNRFGGRKLYNGGIGLILDNSALDASPYALAGQQAPKPAYNRTTGVVTFGGPLQIPHVLKNGPFVFVAYQWTRNNSATTQSALVPTVDERNGILTRPVIDPTTGAPFAGNTIPQQRISPQAQALLNLYPPSNVTGNSRYNFQAPLLSPTHQDALQTRVMKMFGRKDQLFGNFALQSIRSSSPNIFGFVDRSSALGLNTGINWNHRLSTDWFLTAGFQFSRLATHVHPYFANRENVSGDAGIQGNNQDPMNWGPPALSFANGIAGLSDAQSSFDRNQTSGFSYSMSWSHFAHNITFGTDYKRREFNVLSQQDPRGSFTFTGGVTGSALGDFLLGIPDTSSIAFG